MPPPPGELIKAEGHDEIYLLTDGKKHHIHQPEWITKNGYGNTVLRVLTPSEVAAIPTGDPLTVEDSAIPTLPPKIQDGMLLSAKDGKIYLFVKGKRHWILNSRWIAESRYAGKSAIPLTEAQLEELPLGGDIWYASLAAKIARVLLTPAIFLFLFLATKNRSGTPSTNAGVQKWTAWHTRSLLAAIFIAAIAFREPYLLQHPRFWAEEGLLWFQYACTHSVRQTIFFVHPLLSYFDLLINIGAVLSSAVAAIFGLAYAPVATTLLAFLIQVLAIVLILFCKSRLFDSVWKAVAGCMIVLFAPTTEDEIWLNTTNSICFLGLITLVLLFVETEGWPRWLRWGVRGMVVLCGLSSPYSVGLLPLFLISAWRYRERSWDCGPPMMTTRKRGDTPGSWKRLPGRPVRQACPLFFVALRRAFSTEREQEIHCLILILCLLVQLGVVVKTRIRIAREGLDPMRATDVRWDASAINMFVEHMATPALGFATREQLIEFAGLKEVSVSATSFPPRPLTRTLRVGGWLCLCLILLILTMLRGPTLFSNANMLIGVFLVLSSFVCVASLYSIPTGRYAFLPGVSFLLLLLINAESPNSPIRRYACMSVLSYGLAAGMVDYEIPRVQEGPSWAKEVQKWQADPSYSLRVWPSYFYSRGTITYPKQASRKH